jgi:hypothetical protein
MNAFHVTVDDIDIFLAGLKGLGAWVDQLCPLDESVVGAQPERLLDEPG